MTIDALHLPALQKLRPIDLKHIEEHLLRLDGPDRRMRFCGRVSDQAISAYSQRIDWSATFVLGCFIDNELRGMAELRVVQKNPGAAAELAITVERAFQNKGIGTTLVRKMLAIARNRYIARVYMICLLDNRHMQHVARKMEADLVFREGEVEANIWPAMPTYLSIVDEASIDGQALWRAMFDIDVGSSPASEPETAA